MIYKGRLNADKLPSLDIHKKNSIVLLAPPPFQRPRSDSHPLTTPSQHQRELSGNEQERNGLVPNLQPAVPREESFT